MLTVTVTDENGCTLDQLRFDDSNIIHRSGGAAAVHRSVTRDCSFEGLWGHVAFAASWISHSTLNSLQSPAQGCYVIDDDLYRLERDPGETADEYSERAEMLGCNTKGLIRLPRERPEFALAEDPFRADCADLRKVAVPVGTSRDG